MNGLGLEYLRSFCTWLWVTSWQGALLALVVLAIQWVFQKPLSANWRHALWLLVLVRLLLPTLPAARFSAFNWLPRKPPVVLAAVPSWLELHENDTPTLTDRLGERDPRGDLSGMRRGSSALVSMLPLVWLAGFLAMVGWTVAVYLRLGRRVRRLRVETPDRLRNQFLELKDGLRVRGVELVVSEAIGTPLVAGLWRARVILPSGLEEKLSREEMRMVLLHELAHVKRGDLWMAWLGWLVVTLHWFNPVLRWALAGVRQDREMACDEWVLRSVTDARAYGAALVRFMELNAKPALRPGFGTVGIFESKAALFQRARRIASYRRAPLWVSLAGFAILLVAGLCTLTDARDPEALIAKILPGSAMTEAEFSAIMKDLRNSEDVDAASSIRLAFRKFYEDDTLHFSDPSEGDVRLIREPGYHLVLQDSTKVVTRRTDASFRRLLYGAIEEGNPTNVRELLKDGANPNLPPDDESRLLPPLELAEHLSKLKPNEDQRRAVVKTLLEFGASPNAPRANAFPLDGPKELPSSYPPPAGPATIPQTNPTNMNVRHMTAAALSALTLATAPLPAEDLDFQTVVATVNDQPISLGEVNLAIPKADRDSAGASKTALEKLIDQALLVQAARKQMVGPQPELAHFVDERVDTILQQQFHGDNEKFAAALRESGYTLERFKKFQEEMILVQTMRRQISRTETNPVARDQQIAAWLAAARAEAKIVYK